MAKLTPDIIWLDVANIQNKLTKSEYSRPSLFERIMFLQKKLHTIHAFYKLSKSVTGSETIKSKFS